MCLERSITVLELTNEIDPENASEGAWLWQRLVHCIGKSYDALRDYRQRSMTVIPGLDVITALLLEHMKVGDKKDEGGESICRV